MGRTRLHTMFLWCLVHMLVMLSADASDIKHLNIWPMPQSVSYGYGTLYLSNDFELKTEGSNFADASLILKEAFLRSIEVVRATHTIETNTSKIDPSLVLQGIHVVVYSPSDEVLTDYTLISFQYIFFHEINILPDLLMHSPNTKSCFYYMFVLNAVAAWR